MNHDETV